MLEGKVPVCLFPRGSTGHICPKNKKVAGNGHSLVRTTAFPFQARRVGLQGVQSAPRIRETFTGLGGKAVQENMIGESAQPRRRPELQNRKNMASQHVRVRSA